MLLQSRRRCLSLHAPVVMGILNVTPDSFFDGGAYVGAEQSLKRALRMVIQGAAIVDVGGESTGPGSVEVSLKEELARVIPVIRLVRMAAPGVWISVDTWKAEMARQALLAGADMVNDVTALRGDPDMARVVAKADVPVVLMYSKDDSPRTTGGADGAVEYANVVAHVRGFLEARVYAAQGAGIPRERIVIDPGMGAFVSSVARYSMELLQRLEEFKSMGLPIMVGASRKSFIREIWGGERPEDRLEGSLEAAKLAAKNGAAILRVHDVAATVEALGLAEETGS